MTQYEIKKSEGSICKIIPQILSKIKVFQKLGTLTNLLLTNSLVVLIKFKKKKNVPLFLYGLIHMYHKNRCRVGPGFS